MPFNTKTVMEQKQEFVLLAQQADTNLSLLCRRYGISRKTGYKWIKRYEQAGSKGLAEQSKRPNTHPNQTGQIAEQCIVELRTQNPEWGAKKIYKILERNKSAGNFTQAIPARSTINIILKRKGLISQHRSEQSGKWQRFERAHPNELWQMDFKGYFSLLDTNICHPLTIMDDHSRFNLGLFACPNQQHHTVQQQLIEVFKTYGIPQAILTDNGSPWGAAGNRPVYGEKQAFTHLEKWLIQQHVRVLHGRAYHPQTQGKEERFHRTLKAELLQYESFKNYTHCQQRFDWWREKYNCQRPHEAIEFNVPAQKYKPSHRTYSDVITTPEYDSTDIVRAVTGGGFVSFKGKLYKVGKAFNGDHVAFRPTTNPNEYNIFYYNQLLRKVPLQQQ